MSVFQAILRSYNIKLISGRPPHAFLVLLLGAWSLVLFVLPITFVGSRLPRTLSNRRFFYYRRQRFKRRFYAHRRLKRLYPYRRLKRFYAYRRRFYAYRRRFYAYRRRFYAYRRRFY